MNYFKLYQELSMLMTLFLSAGLVLLAFVIYYSARNYRKAGGEHDEPGIPLVLKLLYLAVAVYIVSATVYVAVSGMPIG
jgi:hypothetical protein